MRTGKKKRGEGGFPPFDRRLLGRRKTEYDDSIVVNCGLSKYRTLWDVTFRTVMGWSSGEPLEKREKFTRITMLVFRRGFP